MKYKFLILLFFILSFSCENADSETRNKKAIWINNAFTTLESTTFPKIKAISWWHEDFDNSFLKINSSEESLTAYKNAITDDRFLTSPIFLENKLIASNSGIYHAAFPDFGGTEDVVTSQKIADFETLVGKDIIWAYFSNNWYENIHFPSSEVEIISNTNKIPFIRIMPRTNFDEGEEDPNYSLQKIIDGDFDSQLNQWVIDAKNANIPLLVEFGTEMNGNWFPWSGQFNGAGETVDYGNQTFADGPERFRDAYRHIIDICNINEREFDLSHTFIW